MMPPHRATISLLLFVRCGQCWQIEMATAADIARLLFATAALHFAACKQPPPFHNVRRRLATANAAVSSGG